MTNFTNWTSGNEKIDNFIQKKQLNINYGDNSLFEWIPYNQFNNIKKIGESKLTAAIWMDGPSYYNQRLLSRKVALMCLDKSQDAIDEFLDEV